MASYQLLPHIADIRLQVRAATLEELFRSALAGMTELQKKDGCHPAGESLPLQENIAIESGDRTSLLIDFLSAVLTRSHIQKALYCELSFGQLSETRLSATLRGKPANGFDEDIKAVTYHEAEIITHENGELETRIIFDI